jgi:hypothetical protein
MTTPTYTNIFQQYYRLYRAENVVPVSTDDEFLIGLDLANEAIARWANYDGTYWRELFATLQTASTGAVTTITTGTKTYAAPTAMKEAGGFVKILDSNNNTVRVYPIIESQDAQFKDDNSTYAFFTGNPGQGFTLHLNPAPDSSINGKSIDYVYYKKPTELTTGSSTTECPVAEYIVHRMLANRFRASRNPYYASAKSDAEDALKTMQANNNSGNWADPWKLADNSGTTWGQGAGSGSGFF